MRLNAFLASLVLTGNKLCVHLLETANLAKIFILKLILIDKLASKDNWWSISFPYLLLVASFSLLYKSLKFPEHLIETLHKVQLALGAFFLDKFLND